MVATTSEVNQLVQVLSGANLSVMKKGKTPGDCIRSNDLPLPCQHLLANYADCKRGMVSHSDTGASLSRIVSFVP